MCEEIPTERRDKSNAIVEPILERRGREEGGEKESGRDRACSVVTLDDNLSGCSGSLRDLDTKIFLPFTQ